MFVAQEVLLSEIIYFGKLLYGFNIPVTPLSLYTSRYKFCPLYA